jgi:hypothetical protein
VLKAKKNAGIAPADHIGRLTPLAFLPLSVPTAAPGEASGLGFS